MAKALTLIGIVQLTLVVYLVFKIDLLEESIGAHQVPESSVPQFVVATDDVSSRYVTADEIRTIVAEELAKVPLQTGQEPAARSPKQPDASSESDPVAYQQQVDAVNQTIEFYRSVGDISVSQMQALQLEIGRLEEPARQRALNRLVRALANGEIDGQL